MTAASPLDVAAWWQTPTTVEPVRVVVESVLTDGLDWLNWALTILSAAIASIAGVFLGWHLSTKTARTEREAARHEALVDRRAGVPAEVPMPLDDNVNSQAIKNVSNVPARRVMFERWRTAIESLEREIRAISHAEKDEVMREQGFTLPGLCTHWSPLSMRLHQRERLLQISPMLAYTRRCSWVKRPS